MALDGFNHRDICVTRGGGRSQVEPAYDFDYDAIDNPEPPELDAMAKMADALVAVLGWIISDTPGRQDSPFAISARALALCLQLRPALVPFDSLEEVASHCAVSKQSLSDALLQLRDVTGATLREGKRNCTRDSYKVSAREGWKKRIARLQARAAA